MTSRIRCVVVGRAAGVDQVVWCLAGGAPDMFLVVRDEYADRRWWPLADVLIAPAQPTPAAAIGVAVRTSLRCAGCGLVAVGMASGGCLVLCRDGRHAMVDAEVFGAAVLSYLALVAGVR
ncbi:MAG TPA: hypothetical protein VJX10_20550 [Pseudonocardiaceae bacterium]|nr:hypothetical protein [Pseudonocardiaceae bacterium]